jgi:hypothetical protein
VYREGVRQGGKGRERCSLCGVARSGRERAAAPNRKNSGVIDAGFDTFDTRATPGDYGHGDSVSDIPFHGYQAACNSKVEAARAINGMARCYDHVRTALVFSFALHIDVGYDIARISCCASEGLLFEHPRCGRKNQRKSPGFRHGGRHATWVPLWSPRPSPPLVKLRRAISKHNDSRPPDGRFHVALRSIFMSSPCSRRILHLCSRNR